jgi:hypothetical protein
VCNAARAANTWGMPLEQRLAEFAAGIVVSVGAVLLGRWAIPKRFSVWHLLVPTVAIAIFIVAYKALAPH